MDENRLWVRATDNSGHSIIWMEPEHWTEARTTVVRNMTVEVLNYLYCCGVHSDELGDNYEELEALLRLWWERKNSFRERSDPVPDGYDKYRVFWRPAERGDRTDEGAGEKTPISAWPNWWRRAKRWFQEKWTNRQESR